jgi:hypothetical protein
LEAREHDSDAHRGLLSAVAIVVARRRGRRYVRIPQRILGKPSSLENAPSLEGSGLPPDLIATLDAAAPK